MTIKNCIFSSFCNGHTESHFNGITIMFHLKNFIIYHYILPCSNDNVPLNKKYTYTFILYTHNKEIKFRADAQHHNHHHMKKKEEKKSVRFGIWISGCLVWSCKYIYNCNILLFMQLLYERERESKNRDRENSRFGESTEQWALL